MKAQSGSEWFDRAIAWLAAVLLPPRPVLRPIRVERDRDRLTPPRGRL